MSAPRGYSHLTDEDRAAWAEYETKSRAAADQYKRMPISFWHAAPIDACDVCGAGTKAKGRVCRACRREET